MLSWSEEKNANGHPLPCHWKRAIAVIWTGQAFSVLATCAATFAVIWHVTTAENSALALSAVGIAALLPTALLSPFGGVAADRFNKRWLIIAADGMAGVFSLVMALLSVAGTLSLELLLGLLVVRSAAQAFHGPALMALMPELVPERDMVRINTLDQTLSSLSAIGGPALGMLLYALWGFAAVLVMDAACAALACLCLAVARLPYARSGEKEKRGVAADLREGLGAIVGDPGISALLLMTMAAMLLFMPLGTLSPLLTYDWFGGDGFAASVVEAAGGIGLLAGSVLMMAWGGGKRLVPVLVIAGVGHRHLLHCERPAAARRVPRVRHRHGAGPCGGGGVQCAYHSLDAEARGSGEVRPRHGTLRRADDVGLSHRALHCGACGRSARPQPMVRGHRRGAVRAHAGILPLPPFACPR